MKRITVTLLLLANLYFLNAEIKRYFYTGKINNKYDIGFDISFNQNSIRGKYFYFTQSGFLWLDGSMDKNNNCILVETDNEGNETGSFSIKLSKDLSSIEGFWQNKDKKKKLTVSLQKNCEYKELRHKELGVAVEYPVFSVPGGEHLIVDDTLFAIAKRYFKTNLENVESVISEIEEKERKENVMAESFFEIRNSSHDFKSMIIRHDEYTGGAHPNYYFDCLTLDLKGNRIDIKQVFNKNAVPVIDKLIIEDLRKKDAAWVTDGSRTTFEKEILNNEIPYLFTTTGIEFYFAPYIAGYYAQGSFSTIVPYSKLKTSMIKNNPLNIAP